MTDVIKEYSTIITDRPYILLINPDLKPVLKEILKENSDIVENNPSFKVIFPSFLINAFDSSLSGSIIRIFRKKHPHS